MFLKQTVDRDPQISFSADSSTSTLISVNKTKEVMKHFINALPLGSDDFRFAVIQYNLISSVVFDFKEYSDIPSITAAIDNIDSGKGSSFTAKALNEAEKILFDKVLFTFFFFYFGQNH